MSFESDFLDMMPHTITVYPWASEDSGGAVTYGTPVTYSCAIKDDVKFWKWQDGNEKGPRRMVYLSTGAARVTLKDKLVFPADVANGPLTAFPVYLIHHDDEDGYHHTEIYI